MELNATSPAPLLVVAIPEEYRPLFRRLGNGRPNRNRPVKRGRFGIEAQLAGVRLLCTGMGPRNAREAFADALAAQRPPWIITGGIAGGLDPRLVCGEARFDADPGFPKLADFTRLGLISGRFVLVDRVAATGSAKGRLRRETGADLVDMESAAIRDICRAEGVPSATLRTVSDTADEDLPLDFSQLVDADQQLVWWKLAAAILGSPGRIPRLMRLQRSVSLATERLAEILSATVADEIAQSRIGSATRE